MCKASSAGKVTPCLRHHARSLQKASIQHQAPCSEVMCIVFTRIFSPSHCIFSTPMVFFGFGFPRCSVCFGLAFFRGLNGVGISQHPSFSCKAFWRYRPFRGKDGRIAVQSHTILIRPYDTIFNRRSRRKLEKATQSPKPHVVVFRG